MGWFKSTEAGKSGIGEYCSSGEDRDTAGGMGRWLGRASAVVCWFRARSGMSECANRLVFKNRSSQSQSQSRGGGSGKGSDRDWALTVLGCSML